MEYTNIDFLNIFDILKLNHSDLKMAWHLLFSLHFYVLRNVSCKTILKLLESYNINYEKFKNLRQNKSHS